jgi:hypothetical protein
MACVMVDKLDTKSVLRGPSAEKFDVGGFGYVTLVFLDEGRGVHVHKDIISRTARIRAFIKLCMRQFPCRRDKCGLSLKKFATLDSYRTFIDFCHGSAALLVRL